MAAFLPACVLGCRWAVSWKGTAGTARYEVSGPYGAHQSLDKTAHRACLIDRAQTAIGLPWLLAAAVCILGIPAATASSGFDIPDQAGLRQFREAAPCILQEVVSHQRLDAREPQSRCLLLLKTLFYCPGLYCIEAVREHAHCSHDTSRPAYAPMWPMQCASMTRQMGI